ncbi:MULTISPECIES: BrnT family toxin [unclassified Rhizobium]|uniref:BrnT family toxin n=2 Tax=unclassified Rhizobium TaxID=2613769 RepID=UPI0027DC745C|nr:MULTISPECIES: BrnT family toxin [unclassified Rhizobium]
MAGGAARRGEPGLPDRPSGDRRPPVARIAQDASFIVALLLSTNIHFGGILAMKITWDERKRLANFDKHGLDFAELDADFFLAALLQPAKLGRFKAIGRRHDGTTAVIFAVLGREAVSVISMRPAHKAERSLLNDKEN